LTAATGEGKSTQKEQFMLKLASWTSLAAFLALALGCQQTSVEGPGGKKLTVVKPADQTLRRGETNQITLTINRDNFRDPVDVKFENLPKGVQVQDKDKKIATGDNTATFTLVADASADLVENHEVKVSATGPDGMKVTETFRLSVKEKS